MHLVFSLETGGLENGVVNLCNRLDPASFRPSITVFRGGGALEARVNPKRVELFTVTRHWNNDPTLPFRLARHLSWHKIDVLHTHSWGTLVEGIIAARLARTACVIHGEHGCISSRVHQIALQRALWSCAKVITAVSGPLADRLATTVGIPRNRIQVIENGVDTDRFRPEADCKAQYRSQLGLPDDVFLVGIVGRLVPVKNHLGLLRALARIRSRGVDAHLALAGDGPLRDKLQQAALELDLADQVHLLGNVNAVDRFLNALDVFVLNSHSEGMSNTILEAMACGLPVVATDVGANASLVVERQTGYLVPPDDAESLANALAILATDAGARQAMGTAGRRRVEQLYSVDRMVQQYSALYETLGNVRRRSRTHIQESPTAVGTKTLESISS